MSLASSGRSPAAMSTSRIRTLIADDYDPSGWPTAVLEDRERLVRGGVRPALARIAAFARPPFIRAAFALSSAVT